MDFHRKINSQKYGDYDLPVYPARTLAAHVAAKGLQAGALIGLLVATPAVMKFGKKSIYSSWSIAVPVSATLGCSIALGMLYGKYINGQLTEDGVDDRAYRIYHHAGQRKVDRYSAVGGVAGLCSVIVLRRFRGTLATAATGVAAGVLLYAAEKAFNEQSK